MSTECEVTATVNYVYFLFSSYGGGQEDCRTNSVRNLFYGDRLYNKIRVFNFQPGTQKMNVLLLLLTKKIVPTVTVRCMQKLDSPFSRLVTSRPTALS